MATQEKTWNVANRLHSLKDSDNPEVNHIIAGADEIYDDAKGAKQSDINAQVDAALSDRYTKEDTYNRDEIESLVDPTNYVSVAATNLTTAVTDLLPAEGTTDTIYRIGNWNGTQYDSTMYALYAWNGSAYVCLAVRSFVGEVYDISVNHPDGQGNPTPYADISAALGIGGGNIPADIRRGGMRIQFIEGNVQTSDRKYVQYRLKSNTFSTDVSDWEDVSTAGLKYNLEVVNTDRTEELVLANRGMYIPDGVVTESSSTSVLTSKTIFLNKGDKIEYYGASTSASSGRYIMFIKDNSADIEIGDVLTPIGNKVNNAGALQTYTAEDDCYMVFESKTNIGSGIDTYLKIHKNNIYNALALERSERKSSVSPLYNTIEGVESDITNDVNFSYRGVLLGDGGYVKTTDNTSIVVSDFIEVFNGDLIKFTTKTTSVSAGRYVIFLSKTNTTIQVGQTLQAIGELVYTEVVEQTYEVPEHCYMVFEGRDGYVDLKITRKYIKSTLNANTLSINTLNDTVYSPTKDKTFDSEFSVQALYLNNGIVTSLDNNTNIVVSKTIAVQQNSIVTYKTKTTSPTSGRYVMFLKDTSTDVSVGDVLTPVGSVVKGDVIEQIYIPSEDCYMVFEGYAGIANLKIKGSNSLVDEVEEYDIDITEYSDFANQGLFLNNGIVATTPSTNILVSKTIKINKGTKVCYTGKSTSGSTGRYLMFLKKTANNVVEGDRLVPVGIPVTNAASIEQVYFAEEDCYMVFEAATSDTYKLSIKLSSLRNDIDRLIQGKNDNSHIDDIASKVTNVIDGNCIVFAQMTDSHSGRNMLVSPSLIKGFMEEFIELSESVNADFAIHTGDAIQGATQANGENQYFDARECYLPFTKTIGKSSVPFMWCQGNANHDFGESIDGTYVLNRAIVSSIMQRNSRHISVEDNQSDEVKTYYYFDLKNKCRVIVLDADDYGNNRISFGFSSEQISWLSSALTDANNHGLPVLILSHAPCISGLMYNYTIANGTTVQSVINDFKAQGGNIIAYIYGHVHWDSMYYDPVSAIPYISLLNAFPIKDGTTQPTLTDAFRYDRIIGSLSQYAYDVYVINTETKDIRIFRDGAGVDRYIHSTTYEVSVGNSVELPTQMTGTIIWHIYNTDIATMQDGTITGVSQGSTYAYAQDENGNFEYYNINIV